MYSHPSIMSQSVDIWIYGKSVAASFMSIWTGGIETGRGDRVVHGAALEKRSPVPGAWVRIPPSPPNVPIEEQRSEDRG